MKIETTKRKISISIDEKIDKILEDNKTNKSKLVNFLIKKFFDNQGDIENFKRKK